MRPSRPWGEADPALRVKSYIAWEPLLIKAAGQGVTAIHAGRSSQDILSTQRTAILRDETLEFAAGLEDVIGDLLALAERHVDTIVPSYTNGVAAQPTSYAHHLLGIAASLLRVRERLSECHTRFNMCAMGATVLNGTGWPLDRDAMAAALGFPRPVENALDATSLAPWTCRSRSPQRSPPRPCASARWSTASWSSTRSHAPGSSCRKAARTPTSPRPCRRSAIPAS